MSLTNEKVTGLKIEFYHSDGDSRTWSNLTKIIAFHNRYKIGDEHSFDHNDYNGWEEMKQAISNKENVAIIEPLYMYDHSGLTVATTPFQCRWDSGQVGFVIVTKEQIRENFVVKRVTKKLIKRASELLQGELKTYNQDLSGDVYGFTCYKDGDAVDSCCGFYGTNPNENGMFDSVPKEFEVLLKDVTELEVESN